MNIEQIFLSCLGSGKQLKWELDNNVNLVHTADKKVLMAIDVISSFISKSKKEEIFRDVSTKSVLDLLRKERPDLYGLIVDSPIGSEWVGRQILNFRKRFL